MILLFCAKFLGTAWRCGLSLSVGMLITIRLFFLLLWIHFFVLPLRVIGYQIIVAILMAPLRLLRLVCLSLIGRAGLNNLLAHLYLLQLTRDHRLCVQIKSWWWNLLILLLSDFGLILFVSVNIVATIDDEFLLLLPEVLLILLRLFRLIFEGGDWCDHLRKGKITLRMTHNVLVFLPRMMLDMTFMNVDLARTPRRVHHRRQVFRTVTIG